MTARSRAYALPALGVLLLGLVTAEAMCRAPGTLDIGWERLHPFVWLNMAGAAVYFAAAALSRSPGQPRHTLAVVLALAAAMRVLPLIGPPMLSTDVYRYVWDGRVQARGINPYRFLPAAPELAGLRDTAIYAHINRSQSALTIYPPAAQLIFAAVGRTAPSVLAMKLVMVAFEAVAVGAALALLRRAKLPAARVLIYAWNPLAVWEFAGNGHIDAASIGLIALAWLAASVWRRGWSEAAVGALLGLAVLCKFLPAAVYPAFWRRWDWRALAVTLCVIVALYALYIDAGWQLAGYLPGYADEEGLSSGSGFFLLRVAQLFAPLPHGAERAYIALGLLVLAGLAARLAFGPRLPDDPASRVIAIGQGCAILATATMVVISPHYPWYLAWLALFACVTPYRSVVYLSATGALLYFDPYREWVVFPLLVYGPCLALAAADTIQGFRMPRAALEG